MLHRLSAKGGDINPNPVFANISTNTAKIFTTPGWGLAGSAGMSAGAINSPSLAFAPDGTPYIAYGDQSNGGKATVKKFSAGSWESVGSTSGFSAGTALSTSLAFAPDNTPYVAFGGDDYNTIKATVMKYSDSLNSWSEVGSSGGFSDDTAVYTSLAFSPDGAPYVAYLDSVNFGVSVMKFNGTSWIPVGNPGFSGSDAAFISLAFAPDGTPYVAYQDSGSAARATVMKYGADTLNFYAWRAVGNAGFSANAAYSVSLAIAPDGTPYVAYRDGGNSNKATVMKYNGTAWINVNSAGFSVSGAYFTSLAIAPDGTPYVAYQDWSSSNKATVMKCSGVTTCSWSVVGNSGFSTGAAGLTSLSFAPDGTPHVAFVDSSASSKATVMKLGNKPTINGSPVTTTIVNELYRYTPESTNATSFSITNKPSWASFDTVTGSLTGTPTVHGTYGGIAVTANNIYGSASLVPFSVTVNPPGSSSVKLVSNSLTYATIAAALTAAEASDTLQVLAAITPEAVNLTDDKVIKLEGGYDASWSRTANISSLVSSINIMTGTLVFDQIAIGN